MLNFSQASENNKRPILDALSSVFNTVEDVLEIGSGSGQHAIYFSEQFPQLSWQPTDLPETIPALKQNIENHASENVSMPVLLDVNNCDWRVPKSSMIYTTNTLHIMSIASVQALFAGVGCTLNGKGYLSIYGPFKYHDEFTTASNAGFDQWLKARDPASGIRDFEIVDGLARKQNLSLVNDFAMPANNQLLLYQKI